MKRIFALIVALGMILSYAAIGAETPQKASLQKLGLSVFPEPQSIPSFTVATPDGKSLSLADYKGKYVLLNFWATWCPPCREEMPSMQTLQKKFEKSAFTILAVSVREDRKTVVDFLKDKPYTFPIGLDPDGKVSSMFVGRGIPTTYLIDPQGRAIAGLIGGRKWDSPEVFDAFSGLLAK